MADPIITAIATYIFKKGLDKVFEKVTGKTIKKIELELALKKALNNALDILYDKDLNPSGPGTLDITFMKNEAVIQEIWDKLLDSANDSDIDFELLFTEHLKNWQIADIFTDEQKNQQRCAIHFFIGSVYWVGPS